MSNQKDDSKFFRYDTTLGAIDIDCYQSHSLRSGTSSSIITTNQPFIEKGYTFFNIFSIVDLVLLVAVWRSTFHQKKWLQAAIRECTNILFKKQK